LNDQNGLDEEYLTIAEVAARLKVRPKTIKNKMAAGVFRKGWHYFKPTGFGPRFKWSAVQAWLEDTESSGPKRFGKIPMRRGYGLSPSIANSLVK